ncbi:hypothetical protein CV102_18500 [Natronococcus pandeyae]|uniref:Uncharacterized protein n=1 Tax=Natronococcus pandeyae TaxID=2055836 RepID=A0A8J8Q2G7_9EURY|nr:hypothetical protein [Natronococcus pandeyae]TYL37288.1 hypothetical protein CV102_18500 [Natronococcus pandeyae]
MRPVFGEFDGSAADTDDIEGDDDQNHRCREGVASGKCHAEDHREQRGDFARLPLRAFRSRVSSPPDPVQRRRAES